MFYIHIKNSDYFTVRVHLFIPMCSRYNNNNNNRYQYILWDENELIQGVYK